MLPGLAMRRIFKTNGSFTNPIAYEETDPPAMQINYFAPPHNDVMFQNSGPH